MRIPHWPRTPVELGGRRYWLCFSLGALAEAQLEFDQRSIHVNLLERLPEFNLANLRVLFPHGLRKCHPELDSGAAVALVTWDAVFPIAAAVREAWHAAAAHPADESKRKGQQSPPPMPLTMDQQWERLWALACYDVRLSTDQFYSLTLGQLDSLFRRHERAIAQREFLFGQLASAVVNFSMGRPKEPVRPRDFMPSEWVREAIIEKPKRRRKRQTIAMEVRATMEHFMRDSRD